MSFWRRMLHLSGPMVSEEDRAELAHLQRVTSEASDRANDQAFEAQRLARYFKDQNDRNHLAERLAAALRGR